MIVIFSKNALSLWSGLRLLAPTVFQKRLSCKNIKLSTLSRQEIMGNLSCYFWSEMRNVRAQICKINIFDVKQIDSPGYWTIKTLFV